MKQISNDRKYWIEKSVDITSVGLTDEFISKLGVVWNLVPTERVNIQEGEVFAYVESSKCLLNLKSPIAGKNIIFNDTTVDKPNKINSTTWIMRIK